MNVMESKMAAETMREIGKAAEEVKDFDPDKRMNESTDKLERLSDKAIEDYDPDKRIETTKYYTTEAERLGKIPGEASDFGHWEGVRGNSKFIPSGETEKGRAAIEKLAEKGQDGIEYKNGEADFSKVAEATVQIDNMSEHRIDYLDQNGEKKEGNFTQADKRLAEQWTAEGCLKSDGTSEWTEKDIAEWREERNCSWHECCDTKTMHLVSRDIHGAGKFTHTGGCLECKIRDNKTDGGIFDE